LPEFVDSAVKGIDERLRELRDEVSRLEAARSALAGGRRRPGRPRGSATRATRARATRRSTTRSTTRSGTRSTTRSGTRSTAQSTPAPTTRSRPRATRRGGNTRAAQALELVSKRPGVTIPQLAEAMGIQPNYLYRVLPRLASDGRVKREGQGWHPAS
jgi:hypothetical protein